MYQIKFSFDFEQFFPENDPDLTFYQDFISDFESDDNFLLIAIENKPTVFDQQFLKRFHQFTLAIRDLPHITSVQSLTTMDYPIKTPFGINTIPIIHIDTPERYQADKKQILEDRRFVNSFIDKNAIALTITARTIEAIKLKQSTEMLEALDSLKNVYPQFQNVHLLGRAYFQKELIELQQKEISVSTIIAGILVTFILILFFKKPIGVIIALLSIGLGLLYFLGLLGLFGRELNVMSALYPVLMLIVGTSDVVHIMSKYTDELKKGNSNTDAMVVTIKEIGLATLFTSITTAIGFATLLTSSARPIRDFGINAALGVIVAYITVLFLTTSVLVLFNKNQIIKVNRKSDFWDIFLNRWYHQTILYRKRIIIFSTLFIALCFIGTSKVTMDYKLANNLPKKAKITNDFNFFEQNFCGFRPVEFAITVKDSTLKADSYSVLSEVSQLEDRIAENKNFKSVFGLPSLYKSIERMNNGNTNEAYKFPSSERNFNKSKSIVNRMIKGGSSILVNSSKTKTRISTRIADIGAESIKSEGIILDEWVLSNLDTSIINVKRTGTGLLMDKNAEHIRGNLLWGLTLGLLLVSLLMGVLFKNIKMMFIALIPNFMPVLFAAALLGFLGIQLDAAISVVFAVVFGIAVDDTIHFLSKFKLAKKKGVTVEEALKITFLETGKAIAFTTIILFFGFMVMLFSNQPASVTIGLLISVTLFGALLCDLYLLPILIRKYL